MHVEVTRVWHDLTVGHKSFLATFHKVPQYSVSALRKKSSLPYSQTW